MRKPLFVISKKKKRLYQDHARRVRKAKKEDGVFQAI